MSLKTSKREVGSDVVVVDLSGRIVLGDGNDVLRETVAELVRAGRRRILLNLADVSYIDSSGLGALVSGYTTVTGQQGQVKLLSLTKKVHDLLQITKLLTVFEVFDGKRHVVNIEPDFSDEALNMYLSLQRRFQGSGLGAADLRPAIDRYWQNLRAASGRIVPARRSA